MSAGGMDQNRPSYKKPMTAILLLMLVIGFVLLGAAIHRVWSGAADSYTNEQLRLLAGALTQVFLVGALLAQTHERSALARVLLGLTGGALVWSVVLI